jgi:50S ribosomal protein L16 3-hydroxylase
MRLRLLGNRTPRAFLQRHWQKRPLFVPGALPGFAGVVDVRVLTALAARADVESRMVQRHGKRWTVEHGPVRNQAALKNNSTILVSGVNLHVPAADALLRRFAFVPQARVDDVMVSYATAGGGVGPHVDSYDVFLLQGPGRRKWRIWDLQGNYFSKHIAQAGDLLYLPPGWRHDGVALDPCTTYSIGFRAPRGAELAAAFLDWLNEHRLPDASYRDPRLVPAREPARIPRQMIGFARAVLGKIRWTREDVAAFLGEYLTEPKAHVVFRASGRRHVPAGALIRLDPKTQLLYAGTLFFINGESFTVPASQRAALRELADLRELPAGRLARAPAAGLISDWLQAGYLRLERAQP